MPRDYYASAAPDQSMRVGNLDRAACAVHARRAPRAAGLTHGRGTGPRPRRPGARHGPVRPLPAFAERAHVELERPGGAVLPGELPERLGDGVRLQEEVVRPIPEERARVRDVDDAVDDDVRDVDAAWAEAASHGLREYSLGGLGRGEGREVGSATQRRGRPGDQDRAG